MDEEDPGRLVVAVLAGEVEWSEAASVLDVEVGLPDTTITVTMMMQLYIGRLKVNACMEK